MKLYASATLWQGMKRITMFSYTDNTERKSGSNSHSTLKTKVFVLLCQPLWLIWQCQGMEVQYSVEYLSLVETEGSKFDLVAPV